MTTSHNETITTGVDRLLAYLEDKNLVDMNVVAKDLNTPIGVVQSWTDFLVEENVIGVEYKFTNPFIYLIKKGNASENRKDVASAKISGQRGPSQKQEYQWKYQVEKTLESKKNFFFYEAKKRNLKDVPRIWEEYKKIVTDSQT